MKSWYRTIREDELKDGSIRKVYHLVFETDDKSIVEKIEQFFYDVMDAKTEPNLSEIPTSSTISKMEQVDKDINVRSKDEPQTDCFLCKWLGDVDVCGRCRNRNLFAEADTEPKPKDEPQTDCDHKCIQTEIGCERADCPWK